MIGRIKLAALASALMTLVKSPTASASGHIGLVIGNASYKSALLKNRVNDARAIAVPLRVQG